MKKLPYFIYALLAAAIVGLLAFDYLPDKAIDKESLTRAGLLLAGLVLSVVKLSTRTSRKAANKKALYEKSYSEYIQNVFSQDKKLEKLFYEALDDYNRNQPAAGAAKLEKLMGNCVNRNDRYAVTVFLALCLGDMQLYDKAVEQYRSAVAMKPNSSLYSNMALALERLGREDEAFAAYQQSLHLNPKNHTAWNNMAQNRMRNGYYEEAIEFATKAVETNPNFSPALTALAVCSYMLGDMEAYEHYYRRAVSNGAKGDKIKAYIASLNAEI